MLTPKLRLCITLYFLYSAVSANNQQNGFAFAPAEKSLADEHYRNFRSSGVESLSPGDCSFEYDECAYGNQINNNNWQWSINLTSALRDHTLNSTESGFMSVTAQDKPSTWNSTLESGTLRPTGFDTRCLTFWYWISGDVTNWFRVLISENSTKENFILWKVSGDDTGNWVYAQASVFSAHNHTVVFETERLKDLSKTGFVAIDDIFFTPGPCGVFPADSDSDRNITIPPKPEKPDRPKEDASPFDCNFDEDFCQWTNLMHSSKWERNKGTTPQKDTGPDSDHTDKQGKGYYIYIPEFEDYYNYDYDDYEYEYEYEEKNTQLQSPSITPESNYKCLSFWYHMWGQNINKLNVYAVSDRDKTQLWTKSGPQSNSWFEGRIELNFDQSIQIVFEAFSSSEGPYSHIALDDISFSKYVCEEGDRFNNFEDGFGDYNVTSHWQIFSGSFLSNDSGLPYPMFDHTYNTPYGHYIAINNSLLDGNSQQIKSPSFLTDDYSCVRFWYYIRNEMSNFSIVSLPSNISLFEADGSNNADFYSRWQVAEFTLSPDAPSIEFLIRADLPESSGNDVVLAFDDFEIRDGFCGFEGDCNFEQGDRCSWHNDPHGDVDWVLSSEATDDIGIGSDHTLQTKSGTFLSHLIHPKTKPSQRAGLYSQSFKKNEETPWRCLHFWFIMNSNDGGLLQVVQKFESGKETLIWNLQDSGENYWTFAKVPFDNTIEHFILYIQSTTGQNPTSSVLIDDILISDTNCSIEPLAAADFTPITPQPPPSLSIAESLDCYFEKDTCHWSSTDQSMKWDLGFVNTSDLAPPAKEDLSNYVYIVADDYSGYPYAVLQSIPIVNNASQLEFCFSFDYYVFGSEVGNLSLILQEQGTFLLWKVIESQYDRWLNAEVNINIPQDWTINLGFKADIDRSGVMALDNFIVSYQSCPISRVCQFETHSCQWTIDQMSNLTWMFGRGNKDSEPGPPFDHTTLSEAGSYYIVRNNKTIQNGMGRIVSPQYGANFGTQCMSFWYYMSGAGMGTLSVQVRLKEFDEWTTAMWKRSGEMGNRWHRAQVPLSIYDPFQIGLTAKYNDNLQHFIAIDDLQIVPSICDLPASCNFDDGLCGYTVDYNANTGFEWLIGHGRTYNSKKLSGPLEDAGGKGFYAYVDLTNPSVPWEGRAVLRSDTVPPSKNMSYCLMFSYIQYGAIPKFAVEYNPLDQFEGTDSTIWTNPNQILNQWTKASVAFTTGLPEEIEILFVVEPAADQKIGFVGLDEIKLIPSSDCQEFPIWPTNDTNFDTEYFCDFENGNTCEWVQDKKHAKWVVNKGRFEVHNDYFDHTLKNEKGHSLVSKELYTGPGPAHICIPIRADDSEEKCFMFWYFMYQTEDWLNITLEHQNGLEEILWQRKGQQGAVWRFAQLPLESLHSYNICINSNTDSQQEWIYDGVIAVDDITVLLSPCLPQKTCTFDDGHICEFIQDTIDQFDWSVNIKNNSLLPMDHTLQSEYGKYAYVNSTGRSKGDSASIISKRFSAVENVCVKFWYYIANDWSNLGIAYDTNGEDIRYAAEFMGQIENEWVSAAVPFKPEGDWQLYIHSMVYVFTDVAVAIDDVTISLNDDCSSSINCNFESFDCMWYPSSNYNYLWSRASSQELYSYYLHYPKIDHTLGLATGYFLYIDTEHFHENDFDAFISSSVIESGKAYRCLSFWYYLSKNTTGSLFVKMTTPYVNSQTIHELVPDANMTWNLVQVSLPSDEIDTNMQIKIGVEFNSDFEVFALDDINFHMVSCGDIPINTFTCHVNNETVNLPKLRWCDSIKDCDDGEDELNCGTCTFENGQCDYTDVSESTASWKLVSAEKAHGINPKKAPPVDVTYRNETGHYMLAEINDDDYDSNPRTLMSPIIQQSSPTCHISAWMYNKDDPYYHHLDLDINYPELNEERSLLDGAYISEPDEDNWKNVISYIGNENKFAMKLSMGYWTTVLALDDIKFTLCDFAETKPTGLTCNDDQFECDSGMCIDRTFLCDFSADCSDRSDERLCGNYNYTQCNFETSMCGWTKLETGNMWELESSADHFPTLEFDHTKGKGGSYLITQYSDIYRMGSPVFKPTENCKMTFYYYMKSNSIFQVLTRNFLYGTEKIVFTRTQPIGTFFVRDEITFNEQQNFQIIFQADMSHYSSDFVAIDDISLSPECQNTTEILTNSTIPEVPSDKFSCGDGILIDKNKVCNFQPDCTNGFDEMDCGSCQATNKSLCGWIDNSGGMFRWEPSRVNDTDPTIPAKTVSPSLKPSNFMVSRTSKSHILYQPAYLNSPFFGPTASSCKLKFSYQLDSETSLLQLLYLKDQKEDTWVPFLNLEGSKYWTEVVVDMGDFPAMTQLIFKSDLMPKAWQLQSLNVQIANLSFVNCSTFEENEFKYPTNVNCSFEKGTCNWYQDHVSDDLEWKSAENYIYMINDKTKEKGVARLKSPLLPKMPEKTCFTFSILITGEFTDKLSVLILLPNKTSIVRWTIVEAWEQSWRTIELNIESSDSFQIVFEGIVTGKGKGKIALKDFSLESGICNDAPTFCNFEADDCEWVSDEWIRGFDKNEYIYDHTTGGNEGSYLYVTRSGFDEHEFEPKVAYSPFYPPSPDGSCFQIYYIQSMGGGGSATKLEVNVVYTIEYITKKELDLSVTDWDEWGIAEIDVMPNLPYMIALNVTFADYYPKTIAVDDFQIVNGRCQPIGSCNFETHQCGWESVSKDIHWRRSSGSSPSDVTGPKFDHTLKTEKGYYMFIDADEGLEGYEAILQSPLIPIKNIICFSFYYHMYGKDVGSLIVQLSSYSDTYKMYTLKGNQGDEWQLLQLEIYGPFSENYEVMLEIVAKIGTGIEGDIAIDDISIIDGACVLLNVTELTTKTPTSSVSPSVDISTGKESSSSVVNPTTTSAFVTDMSTIISSSTEATSNFYGSTASGKGWIAGVVMIFLVAFLILGLYIRKKKSERVVENDSIPFHQINNPCYDGVVPDEQLPKEHFSYTEVDTAVPTQTAKSSDEAEGIVNPVYT